MLLYPAAGVWGFAEATLFFVVPDVLLTFAVVGMGRRRALAACFWATLGALAGGGVMYLWGRADPQEVRAVLAALPAISTSTIAAVGADLMDRGLPSLFLAGVTGVPYKIYAASAPAAGIPLLGFLMVSAAARFGRFLLAVLVAAAIDAGLARVWTRRKRLAFLAVFWVLFYTLYWSLVPG